MEITALLDALNSALAEPFVLSWSRDSPRFLLVFTVVYAVAIIVAVTDQKNTRPGAEHGSAAWGDVFRLNKLNISCSGKVQKVSKNPVFMRICGGVAPK